MGLDGKTSETTGSVGIVSGGLGGKFKLSVGDASIVVLSSIGAITGDWVGLGSTNSGSSIGVGAGLVSTVSTGVTIVTSGMISVGLVGEVASITGVESEGLGPKPATSSSVVVGTCVESSVGAVTGSEEKETTCSTVVVSGFKGFTSMGEVVAVLVGVEDKSGGSNDAFNESGTETSGLGSKVVVTSVGSKVDTESGTLVGSKIDKVVDSSGMVTIGKLGSFEVESGVGISCVDKLFSLGWGATPTT
jgi:hypothetical protein